MDWQDEGVVLSVRRHGESSAIVALFTRTRGRHLGLVRGAFGRRLGPVLQPGNTVAAHWRARLADHLGSYTVDLVTARAGRLMENRDALFGLNAVTALASVALPEREAHERLYQDFVTLLDALTAGDGWLALYARWEMDLLRDLGFGLDLATCAVTGQHGDLTHVSPRSGRAVSAEAAAPYEGRLLRLPAFLANGGGEPAPGDICDALALTGHFLEAHVLAPHGQCLPESRGRLIDWLAARAA
jgi:DNA repair protein RecO (recombination protein O)